MGNHSRTTPSGIDDESLHLSPYPVEADLAGSLGRQHIYRQRAMFRAQARALLAERGYTGVHIRDLASRCGVSTQTLYNNLGGREEILCAAVDELLQVQVARARDESARMNRDFMMVFCDLTARLLQPDRDYVGAIVEVLKQPGSNSALAETVDRCCVGAYREHLTTLHERGGLKSWVEIESTAIALQDTIRAVLGACWRASVTAVELRHRLTAGVGLAMLGATCGADAARIEADMSEPGGGADG